MADQVRAGLVTLARCPPGSCSSSRRQWRWPSSRPPWSGLWSSSTDGSNAADSEAEQSGQRPAVVGGVPKDQFRALGAFEVEVGVVVPRETDSTMDLDVLGCAQEIGLRTVGLGDVAPLRQLLVVLGRGPTRGTRTGA